MHRDVRETRHARSCRSDGTHAVARAAPDPLVAPRSFPSVAVAPLVLACFKRLSASASFIPLSTTVGPATGRSDPLPRDAVAGRSSARRRLSRTKSPVTSIRQISRPMPFASANCDRTSSHTLFSMERQITEPIDAVSPRVVLNRTVDGSLPRWSKWNAAGQLRSVEAKERTRDPCDRREAPGVAVGSN